MTTPQGAVITRQIFWNVYDGQGLNLTQMILYAVMILTVGVFIYGLHRSGFMTRKKMWRLGTGSDVARTDNAGRRFGFALAEVFGHRKILREPYQGLLHLFIFYGFLALMITTGLVALQADFFLPLFDWYYFQNNFYLGLSLFADVFGGVAIVGVLMALVRRYAIKPAWLETKQEDNFILWFLLFVLVTGFMGEALRMQATELQPGSPMADYVWFSPLGRIFAYLFAGLSVEAAEGAHRVVWWVHMLSAMSFLAYIPFSKLEHIYMAPANIYMHPETDQPYLKLMPPEMFETAETFGVHALEEYSWKDLFDTEACLRCGRCVQVCPAFNTDKPLAPRDVIQNLRTHLEAKSKLAVDAEGNVRAIADDEYTGPALIDETISKDAIWACTTCMACVEACPCYISQFPKLIDLRRYMVMMESDFPSECQEVFKGMENNSNPWNIGAHTRGDWAKGFDAPLMSEKGAAEYLFYVGDAGSFDDLNKKTAQALVKIFNAVELDYAILGAEEGCDGDSAKKMGNEYLYQALAQTNIEVFNAYGVKKIICMDPHAYNTIKKDYKDLGGDYEVYHYVEILSELLDSGKLKIKNKLDLGAVTLHDSCYLGRYNGLYAEPRKLLSAISLSAPVEMADHHAKSFCCGAGGGRMWMEEHLGSRINQARTKQALACGAATVATGCPYCLTMLSDGVKELDAADKLRAVDLAWLVAEACGLVVDTKGTCQLDEA